MKLIVTDAAYEGLEEALDFLLYTKAPFSKVIEIEEEILKPGSSAALSRATTALLAFPYYQNSCATKASRGMTCKRLKTKMP